MTRPSTVRRRSGNRPIYNVAAVVTESEMAHIDHLAAIRGVSRSAVIVEATEILYYSQHPR